jgi:hypothetical protein
MATADVDSNSESTSPVGSGDYVVQEGECVASIAFEHGLLWETVWNDPGNAEVKRCRKTPFVLLPGDRLVVPELRLKQEARPTGRRHLFVRKGDPVIVKIKVLEAMPPPPEPDSPETADDGDQEGAEVLIAESEEIEGELQPAKNKPYQVIVDGTLRESGETDGEGMVTVAVKPNARSVRLIIEPGTKQERAISVRLGSLDPVEVPRGQAQRLANLGFNVDPTGQAADGLGDALADFQKAQGLDPTGSADAATLDNLQELHGS